MNIEFNKFLIDRIVYNIFTAYCTSDNWTKNVNVLKMLLNDIIMRKNSDLVLTDHVY